ncbi:septum formation protein [Trinickia symbiotica]|uniref:dTTP/UTP pyrophosphatase n=1 Tax=Trinickia symbiotica TaxID=863227 RepID=A0A2N7X322_9BURK|nr:Maf family protein [Trinickia symbiotica]PMS36014.1 septum formation inhibitor Maf [Trinickia symbiotica]PPK45673.1 septum formation protein [Trinickia symbiotica]
MPLSTPSSSPHPFVYLASQSPRRQELLGQLGVRFELLLPRPDEDAEALESERPGESADAYVRRVTVAKAEAARARLLAGDHAPAPILVADTTVTIDGAILGKPDDIDHALTMLERLAGREHDVLTALAVVDGEGRLLPPALSRSTVRFAAASREALRRYAMTGEPLGKAGAYGIQGRAAELIERIEGSYSGIMGLPLFETAALLRAARVEF